MYLANAFDRRLSSARSGWSMVCPANAFDSRLRAVRWLGTCTAWFKSNKISKKLFQSTGLNSTHLNPHNLWGGGEKMMTARPDLDLEALASMAKEKEKQTWLELDLYLKGNSRYARPQKLSLSPHRWAFRGRKTDGIGGWPYRLASVWNSSQTYYRDRFFIWESARNVYEWCHM